MPYRHLPAPKTIANEAPRTRSTRPVLIIMASAFAHVGVLGILALVHRDPPKPASEVVRVMTTEARGGADGPMTMQVTGFRRARVRISQ
jgi:hypothetical protein